MNKYDIFLGIDVGSAGSVTALNADGTVFSIQKLPKRDKDADGDFEPEIFKLFEQFDGVDMKVVVERIWSRPGNNATRAFASGRMYGSIVTCLVGLDHVGSGNCSLEQHTSGKWQKYLKSVYNWPEKSSDYEYTEWKKILKEKAQALFPNETVTLWNCDSLLIAHYCYLIYK